MLFVELIQRNSDICNNCFRRVADTVEQNYAVDTDNGDLYARHVDLPDRRWTRPGATQHQAGDTLTDGTVRACKCGIRSDTIRPVNHEKAMTYIERIADRLEEQDVFVNRDALFGAVEKLLKRPEMQGKQDTVFKKCVERACKDNTPTGNADRTVV